MIARNGNNYTNNLYNVVYGLEFYYLMPLSTTFQLNRGVSVVGGGNWSTRRKPTTCSKSLTNLII